MVRRVNHAVCKLLGYEPSEIVGRHIWDFVAPEEQARSQELVRQKISEERALVPFTREYVRRDGARIVVEIHDNLIRNQCYTRQIEQKNVELAAALAALRDKWSQRRPKPWPEVAPTPADES